jgi:hypothetical protein
MSDYTILGFFILKTDGLEQELTKLLPEPLYELRVDGDITRFYFRNTAELEQATRIVIQNGLGLRVQREIFPVEVT